MWQSYAESLKRSILIRWRRSMRDRAELIRLGRNLIDTLFSNRKVLVGVLVLLGFLLYLWPNWIRSADEVTTDPSSWCVDDLIARDYARDLEKYNSIVHRFPLHRPTEKPFIAFTGNGHIALAPEMKTADLQIRHGRYVSLGTGFQPVVEVTVEDLTTSGAYVTEFTKGTVTRLDFYAIVSSQCVSVSSTMYAHRGRPSVFVQDVVITNPLDRSFEVHFKRPAFKWTDDSVMKVANADLHVVTGKVKVPGDSQAKVYVVTAVLPSFPETVTIKPQKTETFHLVTVVEVSAAYKADTYMSVKESLVEKAKTVYAEVVGVPRVKLLMEHSDVWSGFWQTGFGISKSLAPNVLNGDLINATVYYLLANTPAPLHESQPGSVLDHYNKALANPDRCYSSHNTLLYPSKLWSSLSSLEEMAETVETWKLTLEKRGGCVELLEAGADGLLQAMLLSFGGLKFTQHHLEFNTHPQDLHRNYHFRQIAYSNVSFVNIWIEIDQNNRPVMFVSVNNTSAKESQRLLACDAGCLDAPVQLTADKIQLPVKLTDPLTPILFITDDSRHMNELKHTIHVKEVVEAPGIENHVIAMHKHGHRLGGLPTLFWVSLVFLIVVFHLFLCTLIYNEYCRGDPNQKTPSYGRSRYSV